VSQPDKTLRERARELTFEACPTWSDNDKLETEVFGKIESAILDGMEAALDRSLVEIDDAPDLRMDELVDLKCRLAALKKQLREPK
jgi:hypothetical protein